jgi:hypothetical protein
VSCGHLGIGERLRPRPKKCRRPGAVLTYKTGMVRIVEENQHNCVQICGIVRLVVRVLVEVNISSQGTDWVAIEKSVPVPLS